MQGVSEQGQPRILYTYQSQGDIKQHVTGCDADIGGKSSAHLDLDPDGRAKFWGDIRLEVPRGKEDIMRSGYAGFRSRVCQYSFRSFSLTLADGALQIRTTLFGHITDDLSLYSYLALRVRASGEPRMRSAYFVNIQTDGPVPSDLWQHRLYLREDADGKTWENVLV